MAYTYARTITIDHTKVPNTDQSNFPVLVSVTLASLKTTGNGGNVTSSSGFDIIVSSDTTAANKLAHEIESYDGSAGTINFWVKVASVSHTVDTVIYLLYGDATVTTSQENVTGVWSNSFNAVYHLKENAANNTVNDSTSNALNGTGNNNTSTFTSTGLIYKDFLYNGTSDFIQVASNALLYPSSITASVWVKTTATTETHAVGKVNTSSPFAGWALAYNSLGAGSVSSNGSLAAWFGDLTGGWLQVSLGAGVISDGVWHHLVLTYDGTTGKIYFDGVQKASAARTGSFSEPNPLYIGKNIFDGAIPAGSYDECRIASAARSADWLVTEYNNQFSPSTFLTFGSESTVGDTETLSDQIVLSDATNVLLALLIALSDQLVLSDALTASYGNTQSLSDQLVLSDSLGIGLGFLKQLSDQITLSDLVRVILNDRISFNDTLTILDAISVVLGVNKSVSDSAANWLDAIKANAPVSKVLHDFLNLSDQILLFKTGRSSLSDQISLSDTSRIVLGVSLRMNDQLILSDVLATNRASQIQIGLNDQITLSDQLNNAAASTAILNYLREYLNDASIVTSPVAPLTDSVSADPSNSARREYLRRYLNDIL